ncbi:MAG TPA: hypothetical protein PLT16_12520, partial [Daejeonella sp.]|nr:hypothetical protein [Daejeonella sp.]
ALSFDDKGRIWAVEMENYMPDSIGTGEDLPVGKIVILTDRNGDGKMDQRKIFLDSLVLPRAICFIENGILVAESPNLWFYEIKNDTTPRIFRGIISARVLEQQIRISRGLPAFQRALSKTIKFIQSGPIPV